MKKMKSLLAVLLIACLVLALFAACAKTETPAKTDTPSTSTDTPAKTDDTKKDDAPAKTEEPEKEPEVLEDPADVNFWFYCNSQWKDEEDVTGPVLDAINEILLEKCNAQIHWTLLQPADYRDKVGLALGSGEVIDLLATMPVGRITNYYNQGMLQDMTDLVNEYAPEALELTKDLVGGYTFNGRLYGIPTLRNLPTSSYIYYYTEALEKVGMVEKFHQMKSFDDFAEILDALKALIPEGMYPIGADFNGLGVPSLQDSKAFADLKNYDSIGDTTGTIFIEDGVVKMTQADPRYENTMKMLRDWFDKGYIWPDSLYNTTDAKDDLMKQKVLAGQINGSEYGVEAIKEGLLQADLEVFQLTKPMIGSTTPSTWGVSIPVSAEEPEAACRVINEMYVNSELMNLFVHGIEGRDYNVVDGQAQYVEEPHYSNGHHVVGNALITYPIIGQGADFFEVVKQLNAEADKSKYMGLTLDTSDLQLVISQISAVHDQYKQSMLSGGYTEEAYHEYVSKLEAAGWADYAKGVQDQLDAFVASRS